MNLSNTVTVLGAGYVGLTTAALLAHAGYKVYVVEPNKKRLDVIKEGRSFFFEEGLDPVIEEALKTGQLIPTDSYESSVPNSQVVFSCVGTPDNADGSSNLTYVFQAAEQAFGLMGSGTIFVQKSTVPVGTGAEIMERYAAVHKNAISYVSNPEFLREGTALEDTLYFDRVVAGGQDKSAVEAVINIYRQLESHRDEIARLANITVAPTQGQYVATELASAELIKVTSNAFLALKISFANSIAKLADKSGADIVEVMNAVGADNRIGKAFLNAGRGYGGGCFPKDVSGLIASGLDFGVDLDIMQAAQAVNSSMPGYIIEKIVNTTGQQLDGKKIAVLGLAFKANTSDTRRSPGISLANLLQAEGADVTAFDPKASQEATDDLHSGIRICTSVQECVGDADIVIIATDWPEFISLTPAEYASMSAATVIVDGVNALSKQEYESAKFTYIGVGR